ncbi:MAG: hypothetical protein ACAI38_24740 [Myxococcota bacterium]|nr:hypothetical protein [Myxococcota bacterium]
MRNLYLALVSIAIAGLAPACGDDGGADDDGDDTAGQRVLTLVLDQDDTPGSWGVTATPPGTTYHQNSQTISYDSGTVVTLTAVDAPAWPFLGWEGDLGGANASACTIQITMDVARTIEANLPLDSSSSSLCD